MSIGSAPGSMPAAGPGFELLPAIDLRGGRVVRLRGGDFGAETVFGDDAVAVSLGFIEAGARWIHLVDLDGARDGSRRQAELIREILAAVGEGAACEVAGGLRDRGVVASALAAGAARIVVGTAALSGRGFVRDLVDTFGARRVVVALDVRDGLAVGEAWRSGAPGVAVDSAFARLASEGVTTFEVTSIARDGGMGGPDLQLLEQAVRLDRGSIIASGGIRSIEDLLAVRALGCAGAIVGRAIYEGGLDLAAAIRALSEVAPGPGTPGDCRH